MSVRAQSGGRLCRRSFFNRIAAAAASLPIFAVMSPAQEPAGRGQRAGRGAGPAAPASPAGPQLPLRTTGLEHFGMVVPDVEKAGRFYGAIFNPELHKEAMMPSRAVSVSTPPSTSVLSLWICCSHNV